MPNPYLSVPDREGMALRKGDTVMERQNSGECPDKWEDEMDGDGR